MDRKSKDYLKAIARCYQTMAADAHARSVLAATLGEGALIRYYQRASALYCKRGATSVTQLLDA